MTHEVDAVTGAVVNPHFRQAFTYRPNVARIAKTQPADARFNLRAALPIAEGNKPTIKNVGFDEFNHVTTVVVKQECVNPKKVLGRKIDVSCFFLVQKTEDFWTTMMFDDGLLKGAGLTQAEVARRMGTKASAVARMENALVTGKPSPSLSTLQKYAAALGKRLVLALG
jgi:DNA-binding XRE family transcriptional regulator